MATQGVLGAATLKEFEDGLHGELIRPGDGVYDEARAIWNGAHDARPAVIARCADSSDVRHAIGFARSEGLDVAVRGGSHSIRATAPRRSCASTGSSRVRCRMS